MGQKAAIDISHQNHGFHVFLSEPQRTQYDAQFSLLGIQVRVHPFFWLVAVILGAMGAQSAASPREGIAVVVLWAMVLFFSILVHEFGHALTMIYFGQGARVVLYGMGGLAIPDSGGGSNSWGDSWGGGNSWGQQKRTPWQQVIISAAGPAAGFILAGIVVLLCLAVGGRPVMIKIYGVIPYFQMVGVTRGIADPFSSFLIDELVWSMLFVNILWGVVNLMPVYPLDGGQISRELFVMNDPYKGLEQSLWLSLVAAGAFAVLGIVSRQIFVMFLFGSLAFQSYQLLQQSRGGGGFGGGGGYGGGRGPW